MTTIITDSKFKFGMKKKIKKAIAFNSKGHHE